MTCKYPLLAYKVDGVKTSNGKDKIFFGSIPDGINGKELLIPCGRCINCRINKSREWAVRCVAESKLHKENYFVTLTIDDKNLDVVETVNDDGTIIQAATVKMDDVSKFLKVLRNDQKIKFDLDGGKFLAASEYGSLSSRPHYHLALFGFHIPSDQLKYWNSNSYGHPLFECEYLEKIWKKGIVIVGDITPWSAQYIAKYTVKNTTENNEIYKSLGLEKPSLRMSRRPGIGVNWFEKHRKNVLRVGGVMFDGKSFPIPKSWITIAENRLDDCFDLLENIYSDKENMIDTIKSVRKRYTDKDILESISEEKRRSIDSIYDRENFIERKTN